VVRWMRLERYTTRYCWLTHVASHGIVFSVDVPAIAAERERGERAIGRAETAGCL